MRRVLVVAAAVVALVAGLTAPATATAQEADPVAPTLTVTPATDLVDGQTVTVEGAGWPTAQEVVLYECGGDHYLCASPHQAVSTDDTGAFSATYRVRSNGRDYLSRRELDCRVDACFLSASHGEAIVSAPLGFDPDVPPLPTPTVNVIGNADLLAGQEVAVEGSGFFPDEELSYGQCTSGDYHHPVNCRDGTVTADGAGDLRFTTTILGKVHNRAGGGDVRTIDCRVSQCHLGLSSAYSGEWYMRASTPLRLRGDADEHLVVTPPSGLADGEVVAVDATGLNPNTQVNLAQCVVGDVGDFNIPFGQCVTAPIRLRVDSTGELHTTVAVRSAYTSADDGTPASLNCRVDLCQLILEGEGVGYTRLNYYPLSWVGAPLSFAAGAPAPPAAPVAASPAFTG